MEWAIALADEGLLVQPGYFYDFERMGAGVSLLAEAEHLESGWRRWGAASMMFG
jgi:hypothetical protein